MMKLQNIANIILNEQSKLDSNIVSGTDVVKNKNWYVETTAEDIDFGGLVLEKGPNTVSTDKLVKFAKELSDAKKDTGQKQLKGNKLEDVINYLNSFEMLTVYPKMNFDNKFLVRDSNNVIFLVNHPSARERTHWPDVKFAKNIDKNWVWTNSIPLGKSNDEWLNKNYKLSNRTAQKFNPKVTKNDQLTADLVLSAYQFWGGTDDERLTNALNSITSIAQYNKINTSLKAVVKTGKKTQYWSDEIIFIRRGEVKLKSFDTAKQDLGADRAWEIYGTMILQPTGDKKKMVKYAAIPDYVIGQANVNSNGIPGLIEGEMDQGPERDDLLKILIQNGICKWDSETNSAVFPGTGNYKINLQYDPGETITANDKYHYYAPEEEAPEEEAPEEE